MSAENDGNVKSSEVRLAIAGVCDAKGESDACTELVARELKGGGHRVVKRESIGGDQKSIQRFLREAIESTEIQAIVLVGGTGFSGDEVVMEAVLPFQEKTLPGFSELFRMLCYEEMGSSAIFMRTVSFISEGKAVFCIPRDDKAARIAVEGLIIPQLLRAVSEAASSRA